MNEQNYYLDEPIRWKNLAAFRDRCNEVLGRNAIVTLGSDGALSGIDLTLAELNTVREINRRFDRLDSQEPSKYRNITFEQLEAEIASLDAQIDAVQNLAAAKVVLKKMLADDAKAWRIILWLLKREMNEI